MTPRMEPRSAVEVYVSDKGHVCTKQEHVVDEDTIVTLEPSQVPTVIRWLQESLPEVQQLFEGIVDDDEE